jgi:hypothetical protein
MKILIFCIATAVFVELIAILIGVFKPIKKDVDK